MPFKRLRCVGRSGWVDMLMVDEGRRMAVVMISLSTLSWQVGGIRLSQLWTSWNRHLGFMADSCCLMFYYFLSPSIYNLSVAGYAGSPPGSFVEHHIISRTRRLPELRQYRALTNANGHTTIDAMTLEATCEMRTKAQERQTTELVMAKQKGGRIRQSLWWGSRGRQCVCSQGMYGS